MASSARVAHCQLRPPAPSVRSKEQFVPGQIPVPKPKPAELEATNIVLQPRLCNLRSYGSDRSGGVIRTRNDGVDAADDVSPFFATLSEYIESSRKSHDFEIISGRLAMLVFAGTLTMEIVTGNSVFRKMEMEGIVEAGGVCLGAVAFAAIFAWFSSARNRVSKAFTIGCNTFIDSVIDRIVDSLFYESELSDWSDEL
ncbi:stress enhanced protein 2, chloroplastic-like [Neltuma alba]|uniref:stress enhanced protein 2, chloroplastic-like n=1 Tax=Neltuma alba TaxID=207710 RepID=UPI0010A43F48|nr:stress enhanced protein 2, chloroplastic-like [Prosopis alba]XP_028783248.1 stress enhanced protein 2, chloroplastic-like [Prosopis alba]XP_028783249.1 stress enhanced protein 2, chloroplastic-like [Prosopis alba]